MEEKIPFPLIWYGNISCSHTHCGYENKQLGDSRDRGKWARKGERWEAWRDVQNDVFQGEEIEEERRVERRDEKHKIEEIKDK